MIPRSECRCICHRQPGTVHVVACCRPDEPPPVPPDAILCARCGAVVAAWRVAEAGGVCHCCGEAIDQAAARP